VSALIAIVMAWVELGQSSLDSGPKSSPHIPMKSDGATSAKNWFQE
jgi:hypothetical protein